MKMKMNKQMVTSTKNTTMDISSLQLIIDGCSSAVVLDTVPRLSWIQFRGCPGYRCLREIQLHKWFAFSCSIANDDVVGSVVPRCLVQRGLVTYV